MKSLPQIQDFFNRLWGRQAAAWQKTDVQSTPPAFVLGLSGGLDSIALFHLLRLHKIQFSAVHFHHGLRETADRDTQFCQKLCAEHQVDLKTIQLNVLEEKSAKESIEEAARRLRLSYYQENLSKDSIILLAHHRDDLRENFLLRSLRGSNSSGLTGLKEYVTIQGRNYARPMLKIGKDELRAWLEDNQWNWIEDESNQENDYNRNKVRNIILPELAKVADLKGIDKSLENLAQDADFIQQEAERIADREDFTCETLKKLHPALFPRVIRIFLKELFQEDRVLKSSAIERLKAEIQSIPSEGKTLTLQDDVILKISADGSIHKKIKSKPAFEYQWNWQEEPTLSLPTLNAEITVSKNCSPITDHCSLTIPLSLFTDHGSSLTVRTWRNGDKLVPAGRTKEQKLKKIFSQAKISAEEKNDTPLICLGDKILWIPKIIQSELSRLKEGDESITIKLHTL